MHAKRSLSVIDFLELEVELEDALSTRQKSSY